MTSEKQKTVVNLKKAQSLMPKIIKMLEEDKYCVDIMQQNLAVIGMLKSANHMLMRNHFKTCFQKVLEMKNEKKKEEMIEEVLKVIKLSEK
jgi:CsoR family transcriptional regulator, copper-sensing transcriptional repressor